MLRGILLVLGIFIALSAGAKETPEEILKSLPEEIGTFKRGGEVHTYPHPDLGASLPYGAKEWQITLYVYDHGMKDIQPGISHSGVSESFAMAKEDIARQYLDVEKIGKDGTVLKSGKKLLSAEYRLTLPPDTAATSLRVYSSVHVAGARGHIVKVRATGSVGQEEEIRKHVKEFVTKVFEKLDKVGNKKRREAI